MKSKVKLFRPLTSYLRHSGWKEWESYAPLMARPRAGAFPPGSLSPVDVAKAYGYPQGTQQRTVKIGIGSLGGQVVQSDVTAAFAAWGLPAPKLTFLYVDGASQAPDPQGADVENSLDVLLSAASYAYCTGQAADVTVCFGPNSALAISHVTDALVAAGCEVISWSWGSALSQWGSELTPTQASFANAVAKNCTVTAASGDSSLDDGTNSPTCDYPCSDVNVWAVGGTNLTLNADGSISLEKAWGDGQPGDNGGGGGFAAGIPQPAWQSGIVPGSLRGCPDSSANADPASGYQIMSGGQWQVVGGTSASSPITAGLFAALKAILNVKYGNMGALLYAAQKTAWNDIVVGSNGDPAKAGWDDATGLGSPNGPGLKVAFGGTATPPPPPPGQLSVSIGGPSSLPVGAVGMFSALVTGGTAPVSTAWNFGDGVGSTGSTVTHTYQQAGSYSVLVRVTDSTGATATASASVSVGNAPPLPPSPAGPSLATVLKVLAADEAVLLHAQRRLLPVSVNQSYTQQTFNDIAKKFQKLWAS